MFNGAKTNFLKDIWYKDKSLKEYVSHQMPLIEDCSVQTALADHQHLIWQGIEDINPRNDILGFATQEGDDISVWSLTNTRKFDIKTTYRYINGQVAVNFVVKLWHHKFPPRASLFYWNIFNHAVPIYNRIQNLGIQMASCCDCDTYSHAIEDFDHLFLNGEVASYLWNKFAILIDNSFLEIDTIHG